jgi:hypothetical protein
MPVIADALLRAVNLRAFPDVLQGRHEVETGLRRASNRLLAFLFAVGGDDSDPDHMPAEAGRRNSSDLPNVAFNRAG